MDRIPRSAYSAVIDDDLEEFLRYPEAFSRYEFVSHVINYGTPEMLRIIRSSGFMPEHYLLPIDAAKKGDVWKMKELILAGYEPNAEELKEAAKQGNAAMVKYLLHFTREGLQDALSVAVDWGRLDTVRVLLGAGANIAEKDLIAAYRGTYPDLIEYLISMGADPKTVPPKDKAKYSGDPSSLYIYHNMGGVAGKLVSRYW